MKNIFAATALIITLAACGRKDEATAPAPVPQSDATTGTPSCIQQKINAILAEPVRNAPARILRFVFNGDTVFYITAYAGDQYSELFDKNCNLICHPDGGITGGGDGQCATFWSTATDSVEVWHDLR